MNFHVFAPSAIHSLSCLVETLNNENIQGKPQSESRRLRSRRESPERRTPSGRRTLTVKPLYRKPASTFRMPPSFSGDRPRFSECGVHFSGDTTISTARHTKESEGSFSKAPALFCSFSRSLFKIGAGDEARTRDPQLGKLMLYQLSYTRKTWLLYAKAPTFARWRSRAVFPQKTRPTPRHQAM